MTKYKRIYLAQFGVTSPLDFFAPYSGLIWAIQVSITQDEIDASFWTTNFNAHFDNIPIDETIIINTVSWDGNQLNPIDNFDDLFLEGVQNSFFMDTPNQVLYIKNFYYYPPWQTPNLVSGVVTGVISSADVDANGRPFNTVLNGVAYEPRLLEGSISDNIKLDNWTNNLMQFDSFSFQLINSDGRYDDVRDDVMNQTAKILIAEVEYDKAVVFNDFKIMAAGAIDDVSFPDENTVQVSAADIRSRWDDVIPIQTYEAGQGGVLPADSVLVGKNMPIVYGQCFKVPAYRLDPDEEIFHVSWASAEYPLTEITAIYWDNEGTYEELTRLSVDLDNGTFTLQNGQVYDGSKLFVDMIGHIAPSISYTDPVGNTALDMVIHIIATTSGRPFITAYYNTQHIREVRDNRPYQVGLAFPVGGVKIEEAVAACTFSVNTVFYTNGDVLDIAEMTTDTTDYETVYPEDLINVPPIVWNKENYMSRIATGYAIDYGKDFFMTVLDDRYEDSAKARYLRTLQYDFETALVNQADAEAMGLERYGWFVLIRPEIELQFGSPNDLALLDVISFDYLQHGRQKLQPALYRVTSISKTRNTVGLTFIESQAILYDPRKRRV